MLYDYTAMAVVKTNLVMDGCDKILKSAFPAAVVIERTCGNFDESSILGQGAVRCEQ